MKIGALKIGLIGLGLSGLAMASPSSSWASSRLNCSAVERYSLGAEHGLMDGSVHQGTVAAQQVLWTCTGARGRYVVRVRSRGIGLDLAFLASLVLYCPNLEEGSELLGRYSGTELRASFFLGLDAAVFSNARGSCYAVGFNAAAYGASIAGIELSISTIDP